MGVSASSMNTDQVPPAARAAFWGDWINRLFCGLKSDLYGDTDFDGRMTTVHVRQDAEGRMEADPLPANVRAAFGAPEVSA